MIPNLPAVRADRKLNQTLYEKMRSGDVTARDKMIEANIGLAIDRVQRAAIDEPRMAFMAEDLESAALTELVACVDLMGRTDVENPTGYLIVSLDRCITRTFEAETTAMPRRTYVRRKAAGKDVTTAKCESLDFHADSLARADESAFDMRELIDSCIETPQERSLIDMRVAGHTDKEIAEALALPRSTVASMRAAIQRRIKDKLPDPDNFRDVIGD